MLRLLRKMSPRHPKCCTCHTESSSCTKSMTTVSPNETLHPFKTLAKIRCHEKLPPKQPLISAHACQHLAMCRKCHACHTDDKVSDVPHLSRKTTFHTSKFPYSTTPATKNGHCSKTDHCALVKVDLHKGQNRVPHFVRACANKSRDHKRVP